MVGALFNWSLDIQFDIRYMVGIHTYGLVFIQKDPPYYIGAEKWNRVPEIMYCRSVKGSGARCVFFYLQVLFVWISIRANQYITTRFLASLEKACISVLHQSAAANSHSPCSWDGACPLQFTGMIPYCITCVHVYMGIVFVCIDVCWGKSKFFKFYINPLKACLYKLMKPCLQLEIPYSFFFF